MSDDHFLARWSRRKADLKSGRNPDSVTDEAPARPTATIVPAEVARPNAPPMRGADQQGGADRAATVLSPAADPRADVVEAAQAPPPPTLADVALLTREDSYARFVAPGVDPTVRNAAMKKLFTDPHYNVMDGLDIYIDDYGIPDPIPMAMLRRMTQSKSLGLFDHEEAEEAAQAERERQRASGGTLVEAGSPEPSASDNNPPLPVSETSPDEDPDLQLQPDDGTRRSGAGPGPDQPAES